MDSTVSGEDGASGGKPRLLEGAGDASGTLSASALDDGRGSTLAGFAGNSDGALLSSVPLTAGRASSLEDQTRL